MILFEEWYFEGIKVLIVTCIIIVIVDAGTADCWLNDFNEIGTLVV